MLTSATWRLGSYGKRKPSPLSVFVKRGLGVQIPPSAFTQRAASVRLVALFFFPYDSLSSLFAPLFAPVPGEACRTGEARPLKQNEDRSVDFPRKVTN